MGGGPLRGNTYYPSHCNQALRLVRKRRLHDVSDHVDSLRQPVRMDTDLYEDICVQLRPRTGRGSGHRRHLIRRSRSSQVLYGQALRARVHRAHRGRRVRILPHTRTHVLLQGLQSHHQRTGEVHGLRLHHVDAEESRASRQRYVAVGQAHQLLLFWSVHVCPSAEGIMHTSAGRIQHRDVYRDRHSIRNELLARHHAERSSSKVRPSRECLLQVSRRHPHRMRSLALG